MKTTEERLQKVWPEWEIVRQIGRGGYGVVYEAVRTDSKLTSRAAIKAISISQDSPEVTSLLSDGFTVDMTHTYIRNVVDGFINEIQMMETFKGTQNIVSVEDYKVAERRDEFGWDIYIRMELLTPLPKYVQQHYMSESDVAQLGVDICKALDMCASRGVIHRDIKPENIFVNDFGDFKLGDFGVARRLEGMTVNLSRKGTYSYVAPEVEHGKQYDSRADIYSLGLVLYRMLNRNMMPFLTTEQQLTNPVERVQASQRRLSGEKLPPPADASQAMADIICKACAFEPEDRYQTATAMKKELIAIRGNAASVVKAVPAAASNTVKTIDLSGKSKSYQTGKILALTISLAIVMVGGLVALALAVGRHDLPTVPVPVRPSGASSEEAPVESSAIEEPASHSVASSEASSEVFEDPETALTATAGSVSGSSEGVISSTSSEIASEKAASEKAASEKAASEEAAAKAAAESEAASEKAASEEAATKATAESEAAASAKAASSTATKSSDPTDFIPVGSKGYQLLQEELAKCEGRKEYGGSTIISTYNNNTTDIMKTGQTDWYVKIWYVYRDGELKSKRGKMAVYKAMDTDHEVKYMIEYTKPQINKYGQVVDSQRDLLWQKTYDENWNIITDRVRLTEEQWYEKYGLN